MREHLPGRGEATNKSPFGAGRHEFQRVRLRVRSVTRCKPLDSCKARANFQVHGAGIRCARADHTTCALSGTEKLVPRDFRKT